MRTRRAVSAVVEVPRDRRDRWRRADRARRAARRAPSTPSLIQRALTHRSYAYENGGLPTNERLEFLGDAVLGLVVTDTLYRAHPDLPEGQLAKLRVGRRQRQGAGRRRPRARAGRLPAAGPRRGGDRRPRQGLDPGRHRRGGARRGLPGPGPVRVRGPGAPALRPAHRLRGRAWAPGWTGRPRCRSSPPTTASACPSTRSGTPVRTTRSSSRPWSGWPARTAGPAAGAARRRPSRRPRRPRGTHCNARPGLRVEAD